MNAKRKGFYYTYDEQKIKEYSNISAREKLEWLYEANQFCKKNIKGKTRKIWESFRSGAI
jgi:hypothetical protein